MLNNIGGGVYAFEKRVHVFEKRGLLKHCNISSYYYNYMLCNYPICLKHNFIGNSQRIVDNVQTIVEPLFKQHEDL